MKERTIRSDETLRITRECSKQVTTNGLSKAGESPRDFSMASLRLWPFPDPSHAFPVFCNDCRKATVTALDTSQQPDSILNTSNAAYT